MSMNQTLENQPIPANSFLMNNKTLEISGRSFLVEKEQLQPMKAGNLSTTMNNLSMTASKLLNASQAPSGQQLNQSMSASGAPPRLPTSLQQVKSKSEISEIIKAMARHHVNQLYAEKDRDVPSQPPVDTVLETARLQIAPLIENLQTQIVRRKEALKNAKDRFLLLLNIICNQKHESINTQFNKMNPKCFFCFFCDFKSQKIFKSQIYFS